MVWPSKSRIEDPVDPDKATDMQDNQTLAAGFTSGEKKVADLLSDGKSLFPFSIVFVAFSKTCF